MSGTHTESLFFGKFAFGSAHPLRVSAAVHVKTALNSPRNCWHTSVGVSPSTLCSIPRGRREVLPPPPPLGATGERLVALHTPHPSHPLLWTLGPCATSFANPPCWPRQGSAPPDGTRVHFVRFDFETTASSALISSISASAIVKGLRWN